MKTNGLILSVIAMSLAACGSAPKIHDGHTSLDTNRGAAVANADASAATRAGSMQPLTRMTSGETDPARSAYIAGKAALGRHNFDEAIVMFGAALGLQPKMVDAHAGLGVAYSFASRHKQAVTAFERAIELEPANANWHANLGKALARTGQFDRAKHVLAHAWSLAPGNARIESVFERVSAAAKSAAQRDGAKASLAQTNTTVGTGSAGYTIVKTTSEVSKLEQVDERVFNLNLAGVPVVQEVAQESMTELSAAVAMNDVSKLAATPVVTQPPLVASSALVATAIKVEKSVVAKAMSTTEPVTASAVQVPAMPAIMRTAKTVTPAADMNEVLIKDLEPGNTVHTPAPAEVAQKMADVASGPAVPEVVEVAKVAEVTEVTVVAQVADVAQVVEVAMPVEAVELAELTKLAATTSDAPTQEMVEEQGASDAKVQAILARAKAIAERQQAAADKKPVMVAKSKPVVAKASPTPRVAKPGVADTAPAAPSLKAIKLAAMTKPEVSKVATVKPAKAKPAKIVPQRPIKGLVIAGSPANQQTVAGVFEYLASEGLRPEKIGKPNAALQPLTEIHYRIGYESEVARIRLALPIRAYVIALDGLPEGVNVQIFVGDDLRRANATSALKTAAN